MDISVVAADECFAGHRSLRTTKVTTKICSAPKGVPPGLLCLKGGYSSMRVVNIKTARTEHSRVRSRAEQLGRNRRVQQHARDEALIRIAAAPPVSGLFRIIASNFSD
jgi:hypothetical protein